VTKRIVEAGKDLGKPGKPFIVTVSYEAYFAKKREEEEEPEEEEEEEEEKEPMEENTDEADQVEQVEKRRVEADGPVKIEYVDTGKASGKGWKKDSGRRPGYNTKRKKF